MRPLTAYFSHKALEHNLSVLQGLTPNSRHCAVIKADAYGHQIEHLLPLLDKRVDLYAVAAIEEAMAIRQAGGKLPILLLEGVFEPEEYQIAAKENFAVVLSSEAQMAWLKEAKLERPLDAFLKVDSGMHRLGVKPQAVPDLFESLKGMKNIASLGLMSHFATADEENHPLTQKQIELMEALEKIDAPQSIANSAAILKAPTTHKSMVRFGIALYGASPMADRVGADFDLKPLITLKSRIIHHTRIEKGESVGYGARFVAPEKMPIGVIAGGYADGYPREISEEAFVLVGEHRAPIIGRPAMDMMMIDLRNVPVSAWKNEVTLFGERLPIEWVANWAGTIPYTIFTHLSKRIHFKVVD